ncbi:MAG: pyridoxamine 5'-phosphate oxidase family protein [Peptococcaceae bacterium]|jgi:uncharacterized pyridoxamine 5'-phosphate oxidase family protein|nr:pyridoxamine 5'-phosphate oxidase family protein [Peptococcaceae bacterium]
MAQVQEVYEFLKNAKVYFLATVEGDQPRVRPFGTYHVFEDKLYIQTGKAKDVSKQIAANPKVEISAFDGENWIRIAGTLVDDQRVEAKASILDAFPNLKDRYAADDPNTQALYFKHGKATFSSFAAAPRTIDF